MFVQYKNHNSDDELGMLVQYQKKLEKQRANCAEIEHFIWLQVLLKNTNTDKYFKQCFCAP